MELTHDPLPGDPADPVSGSTLAAPHASTVSTVERERDALRIQAAAVVAQQAALMEEELRLRLRQAALEQQEQQLVTHLEQKRRRLVVIRDEAREAHTALLNERATYEQRVAQVMRELGQARREVTDAQRHLQTERGRLRSLRRRLKRRWHRQWAGERAAMRRRESTVIEQSRALEGERQRLHRQQVALAEARLRFNGETELGRRQLQAEWEPLREERRELEQRVHAAAQREAALAHAERQLAEDQCHREERLRHLEAEAEGLENRIRNRRRNLAELEQQMVRLQGLPGRAPPAADPPPSPARGAERLAPRESVGSAAPARPQECVLSEETELFRRLARAEKLVGELADQRLVLAEQCARLGQAQEKWQEERSSAVAELEIAGRRLEVQAHSLWSREQALEILEQGLRRRSEEMTRLQRRLEAGQVRLSAEVAGWEGERDRLLASIRVREEDVQQRLGSLMELRERWHKRRHRQVLQLRARRAVCEKFREECVVLREEWSRRNAAMQQKQRSLAEQALALEQYRQEHIGKASNPKAAEKRLERLRRRWAALHASAERALANQRESVKAEVAHLGERYRQLHEQEEQVTAEQADLSARQSAWEREQALAAIEHGTSRQEVQTLHRQKVHYEEQLQDLREEVERLAVLFLDDGASTHLAVAEAA
jgi:chromosome segregation ATPase